MHAQRMYNHVLVQKEPVKEGPFAGPRTHPLAWRSALRASCVYVCVCLLGGGVLWELLLCVEGAGVCVHCFVLCALRPALRRAERAATRPPCRAFQAHAVGRCWARSRAWQRLLLYHSFVYLLCVCVYFLSSCQACSARPQTRMSVFVFTHVGTRCLACVCIDSLLPLPFLGRRVWYM